MCIVASQDTRSVLIPPPAPVELGGTVRVEHLPVDPPPIAMRTQDIPPPTPAPPPDPARPNHHTLPVVAHDHCPGESCQCVTLANAMALCPCVVVLFFFSLLAHAPGGRSNDVRVMGRYFGILPQLPLEVTVPVAHQIVFKRPWLFDKSAFQARGKDGLCVLRLVS